MSDRIKLLDKSVSEKIAAGEVIEKPASVVKELVENSIDALASRVEIEVRDGGRNRIKISDNGIGMSPADAILSFERHSTSKISSFEELYEIRSFGFRGEAIASISAVSYVELITREKSSLLGTKIIFEGGNFLSSEECGCPEGTTFTIDNLFFNVPARRKFLSSARSEQNAISKVLTRLALAHPEIFFTFISEHKTVFSYHPVENLSLRVEQIYGKTGKLIDISSSVPEASIFGVITHPSVTFSNRSKIFTFVNKRYVRSNLIISAIQEGWKKIIPHDRFPMAVLFIDIDPHDIDVNIHPTKEDIKFSKDSVIFSLVKNAIKTSLIGNNTTSISYYDPSLGNSSDDTSDVEPFRVKTFQPLLPFQEKKYERMNYNEVSAFKEEIKTYNSHDDSHCIKPEEKEMLNTSFYGEQMSNEIIPPGEINMEFQNGHPEEINAGVHNILPEEINIETSGISPEIPEESQDETDIFIIGNFNNTYIIASKNDELLLIDQHVAHERINFELLKKNLDRGVTASQRFLMPRTIHLSHSESQWLEKNIEIFSSMGFEIEAFGEGTFLFRGLPSGLERLKGDDFFKDIICEFLSSDRRFSPEILFNEIMASVACKASVRAGEELSLSEMERLVKRLFKTEHPYYCPHGRPVIVSFSRQDLGKLFKRV